ncbi:MAG: formylglycine-generating enzyme family protein [Acidobacteriia bacterium]|nr:formylglycine-generating enzyme family protein [Terriglobia bacterium]
MRRLFILMAICVIGLSATPFSISKEREAKAVVQRNNAGARPATTGATPGTVRENPKDGLRYVWIPPGTFMMGCSPGDNECFDEEKPAHQVRITKGFWIGQTEVTVAAWKRFAAASSRGLPLSLEAHPDWAGDDQPMIDVNWFGAAAYCRWAGGRLPTEAEWEYAARGGSAEARYGKVDEIAWYEVNSGGRAHEAAQKRPNGFGLYDMLGNVWEWVNDWYDDHYYPHSPSQDPPGARSSTLRGLRGGSRQFRASFARASDRFAAYPEVANPDFGVRCVWKADSP